MSTDISQAVYNVVEHVPPGKVTTYGDVAKILGLKTPRQVGWALHRNPSHSKTPCHRVVFSDGKLSGQFAFGGSDSQRKWLESEGVIFKGDKVDLKKCRWLPNEEESLA
jgi:methylated-DNA-protein-cysteine methyltransferase related protein